MKWILQVLAAGLSAVALLALPATAAAEWDWDWYDGWEYEYGVEEYGSAFDGYYDQEDLNDDWYYDYYDYDDDWVYEDANEIVYDADVFTDDEWEPEDEGLFEDEELFDNYGYEAVD